VGHLANLIGIMVGEPLKISISEICYDRIVGSLKSQVVTQGLKDQSTPVTTTQD